MVTDLIQIRAAAEAAEDENWRFRTWMKFHDYDDKAWRRIAEEIQNHIDCRACANCCHLPASVNDDDIERLASRLEISVDDFKQQYTVMGELGDVDLKMAGSDCVFLNGKDCTVYDIRPAQCRSYPHLVGTEGSLSERAFGIVVNAGTCPIVYNSLQAWKDQAGFGRPRSNRNRRRRRR